MSTQHANARFLVPHLARMSSRIRVDSIGNPEPAYVDGPCSGWALFMDGDMLVRGNLARMFESLDRTKAVYCVQHRHEPQPGLKMDAQIQTRYARKNWSSFVAFNVGHPANKALTLELINSAPGRDLHRFCWLADSDIGELGPEWNYLVGITHAPVDPKVVHFTEGCPDMDGYHDVPFADEWNKAVNDWARGAMSFGT
jgi:hypothetical protein